MATLTFAHKNISHTRK